jgi:transposase InsO family protein
MKQDYPKQGIMNLCRLFGKTRHAYYDRRWRSQDQGMKDDVVLQYVLKIREKLPGTGTLKLHEMLREPLGSHQIKIGRDYLFDLLREHHLGIRRRKRKVITTDSRHWMHKYNNLVKDLAVTSPEQVWVSDITYIRLINQWGYLSLVTDAYSHKIMGYGFRKDLSAKGCLDALEMALRARLYPQQKLVHHSDRGCQYCCQAYVDLLVENGIAISMTENGDPYENPIAERVNGIIKTEFNLHFSPLGLEETTRKIEDTIEAYNELRPHASCDYLTPLKAHLTSGPLRKRWKSKVYKTKQNAACITGLG